MTNGSVITDFVTNEPKQSSVKAPELNKIVADQKKNPSKKEDSLNGNLFSVVFISILILVILIGISIISYLKTK